jgi:hypothetical protein
VYRPHDGLISFVASPHGGGLKNEGDRQKPVAIKPFGNRPAKRIC